MKFTLNSANSLPMDGTQGCLIGRAWVPHKIAGPSPVILRGNQVFDISNHFNTISELLETDSPISALAKIEGQLIGNIDEIFANTLPEPDPSKAYFLAPIDLQVIKAAGVTFAASMLERVIEEQAAGDADKAQHIREIVQGVIGDSLKSIQPGSVKALELKKYLIEQNMWSQYL
ncbi:MAG TPA: hypothetical protein VFD91_12995, partial [Mariniphaga sp.]|nr:hypothetical protein [Mariniphaga sp.]